MTLTTTLGLLLLLTNPQPQDIPASILLFQAQENSPAQNPPEQTPPQNQTEPAHVEGTNPAAQLPGAADGPNPAHQQQSAQGPPKSVKPKPAVSRKKKYAKTSAARKPEKKQTEKESKSVVVVRNGGTSDSQGQISSGTTDQQAPEQLKKTNSLLNGTTLNLQKISAKELNPNQQDMVKQIRNYMQQSKRAAAAGDVQGATNLAFKAHLLSEELIKH